MCEDTLKKWISQVRKGTVELCILGLIKSKETYAFEMVQELEKIDGMVLSEGTIYPLLKRLQTDELISSFWSESDSGPPRKYYRITEKGKNLLEKMMIEWSQFTGFINNILERSKNDDKANDSTREDQQIRFEIRTKS